MAFRFLFSLILMIALLQACSMPTPFESVNSFKNSPAEIVGGYSVDKNSLEASFVAMIYGEDADGKSFICTGTFISDSALLTAGHCVGNDVSTMSVFFGNNPLLDENSFSLTLTAVRKLTLQDKDSKRRLDLAILRFSGGLPKGARIANLPTSKKILKQASHFLAIGYGRTEGRIDSQDFSKELGILRAVQVRREHLISSKSTFVVNQRVGKGVCFGDSGGPALVQGSVRDQMTVVGIASGVSGNPSISSGDDCEFNSIYMDAFYYRDWITKEDESIVVK